jgi:transcriptional regulator with XRE-family HTH domain
MSTGRAANKISRELGRRIKTLREKRNWSQADMAAHTGLDRSHISEIESGKRAITLVTLQTVASGLDTTMSILLKGL